MAKIASPVELSPDSGINPRPAKAPPRARRAGATALGTSEANAANARTIELSKPDKSVVKPVLIGVGIGAAVAVTGFVIRARSQVVVKPERSQPTLASALTKAALFAVGRLVAKRAARALAQRAAGMLAKRAVRQVAKAWVG